MNGAIILWPTGLLEKHGFQDGDVLSADDDLWDYADAEGVNLGDVDLDRVLLNLVLEFVVPVVDHDLDVFYMETQHNPIRTRTLDGEEVDYLAKHAEIGPEQVEVPYADVLRVIREQLAR